MFGGIDSASSSQRRVRVAKRHTDCTSNGSRISWSRLLGADGLGDVALLEQLLLRSRQLLPRERADRQALNDRYCAVCCNLRNRTHFYNVEVASIRV